MIDVVKDQYRRNFSEDMNPYISEKFLGSVEDKADKIVRLMKKGNNSMGLIGGMKNNALRSPFSAPFGGFHYTHEYLSYEIVYNFLSGLQNYVVENGLDEVSITLPPDIYQTNMNAKCINAFVRLGFTMSTPELINWVDLSKFDGTWIKNSVSQNYRKALKHKLTFHVVDDDESVRSVYEIILRNREYQGRKIYMSLEDLLKVNKSVMPVDFFLIRNTSGANLGAGVFYRGHDKIAQGIFMGDDMVNRSIGVMDLLYGCIYNYYKEMGFEYIDLGSSGLDGEPNIGLLRFKEIHNCAASLKYTFSWSPNKN